MQIVERDRGYPELLSELRGKRVLIWTCNTCARLCNSIGGEQSAKALADRLSSDGIDVVGVMSVSASCIKTKILEKRGSADGEFDVLLTLTCNIGSKCASEVFGSPAVNPIITIGAGYIDENGVPVASDGRVHSVMMSPYTKI